MVWPKMRCRGTFSPREWWRCVRGDPTTCGEARIVARAMRVSTCDAMACSWVSQSAPLSTSVSRSLLPVWIRPTRVQCDWAR